LLKVTKPPPHKSRTKSCDSPCTSTQAAFMTSQSVNQKCDAVLSKVTRSLSSSQVPQSPAPEVLLTYSDHSCTTVVIGQASPNMTSLIRASTPVFGPNPAS
jgi:hypothetical protein